MTHKCTWCGDVLPDDEQAHPSRNTDGETICDACYTDEYKDTCPSCEDYYLKSEQRVFVVFDPEFAPVGVYEKTAPVFFGVDFPLRSGEARLLSTKTLDKEVDYDFYPAAYLCEGCAGEMMA